MRGVLGAVGRVCFGLGVGLLLAEGIVRLLGLGPTVAPQPMMIESADKSLGLECYPDGRADPADLDLREVDVASLTAGASLDPDRVAEAMERGAHHCVQFDYNAWTRRDKPFAPVEGPAVLLVGDSFTEGAGVRHDDTFAVRLDGALPARVFNGGRRGLDQPELIESMKTLLTATEPDLVVYALTLNDFEQDPGWAEQQAYLNDLVLDRQHMGSPTWKLPSVLQRSALAVLIAERRRSARATAATIAWYAGMTGAGNAGGWLRTKDDLAAMRDLAEAAGARFVVVVIPLLVGLDGDYPFEDLHRDLRDACGERELDCVDLLGGLRGVDPRTLHVHAVDMHPNSEGHRRIAEALEPLIRERL